MLRRRQWWSLLLPNLNVIHTRSNRLCWKTQEKFQVVCRFWKTISCSYVSLPTTYLAKKTMPKVSHRNTRKRSLLISKITLKISDRRHLTTSYLLETTVQNLSWKLVLRIYTNLQSSLTARNFNNSRPIYVVLWEMRNHYRNNWLMKNLKCQNFLFLKQRQKWTNFSTFYLVFKGSPFQYHKVRHPNFFVIYCILKLVLKFELKKDSSFIKLLTKVS